MPKINLVGFGYNESETVTGNKTLAEANSGLVQNVVATATITLPATVNGMTHIIRVGADSITVTIAPNAVDKIMGNGFTSVDAKAMIFTSQPKGSYVVLTADGVNGWFVQHIDGIATRAA